MQVDDWIEITIKNFINEIYQINEKEKNKISMNLVELNEAKSKIKDMMLLELKSGRPCQCDTVICQHKLSMNQIFIFVVNEILNSCIRIQTFYPNKYLAMNLYSLDSRQISTIYDLWKDTREMEYKRYIINFVINDDIFIPDSNFDIFEGFEFEENMEHEIVDIELSGSITKFEINNKKIFNEGNFVPLLLFNYNNMIFKFSKKNIPCKLIVGNLKHRSPYIFPYDQYKLTDDKYLEYKNGNFTIHQKIE